jgi:hypothetical protein
MDKQDNAGPLNVNSFLFKQENTVTLGGIYIEQCSRRSRNLAFRGQWLQYTSLALMIENSVLFTKHAW